MSLESFQLQLQFLWLFYIPFSPSFSHAFTFCSMALSPSAFLRWNSTINLVREWITCWVVLPAKSRLLYAICTAKSQEASLLELFAFSPSFLVCLVLLHLLHLLHLWLILLAAVLVWRPIFSSFILLWRSNSYQTFQSFFVSILHIILLFNFSRSSKVLKSF